jgi:hypothetical protein
VTDSLLSDRNRPSLDYTNRNAGSFYLSSDLMHVLFLAQGHALCKCPRIGHRRPNEWRSRMSLFRREGALDSLNVIEVVTGEHPHDVLDRFFAAFGMNSMVLPLCWRE